MKEVLLQHNMEPEPDFIVKTRFTSLTDRFKKLIKNLTTYYERGILDNILVILNQLIRDLVDFKHSGNVSPDYLAETNHQLLVLGLLRASLIDVIENSPEGTNDFSTILKMINYSRYDLPEPQLKASK